MLKINYFFRYCLLDDCAYIFNLNTATEYKVSVRVYQLIINIFENEDLIGSLSKDDKNILIKIGVLYD